jgi:hypothetical protein
MSIADIKQMIAALRAMALDEQTVGLLVREAHRSNTLLLGR